jgi:hypothetical protein
MPYIKQEQRDWYKKELDALIFAMDGEWDPGITNYVIYKILLAWFASSPRYKTICSIMGTLACVSQEFYRKIAAPYENNALTRNGEIEGVHDIWDKINAKKT